MEPNYLGTPIVTSVLNSARETTVTVVVSTQDSSLGNMEEKQKEKKPPSDGLSVSQMHAKNVDSALQHISNRTHKIDASTTMGVMASSLTVPPVQVPATPLKLQQLLTQSHQQSTQADSPVVVQLPVSAPSCGSSDPSTITLPSSLPSVLHTSGLTSQPVVVQVGQGRQQVTCVPTSQTVGLSGQRSQECHLLQPHAGLMPSVVVQVAKGSQKVVPSPVVTQSGARVLPILPLYLQPAGGGGSGGLTAVMNPMSQVVSGGGSRSAARACGIVTSSSSVQTLGGTSAAAEAIVKKKKPIAPTPTHFLPLSLPLPLPLSMPMSGTQSQPGRMVDPPSTPHTTATATTTTFAYVGTIIEGAGGGARGGGVRSGDDGTIGAIPHPGSKVLLAPSLSVLPHRGPANSSGGMPSGARLLLPMCGGNPPASATPATINLKISNGQIQSNDNQAAVNAVTQLPGGLLGKQDQSPRTMTNYVPTIVTTTSAAVVTSPRPHSSTSPVGSPSSQSEVDGERRRRLSHDLSRCLQEVVDAIFAAEDENPPPPSPPAPLAPSPAMTTGTTTITTTTTTTTTTSSDVTPSSPVFILKSSPAKEASPVEVKEVPKVDVPELKSEEVKLEKSEACEDSSGLKNPHPSANLDPNLDEFDPVKVLEWRDGIGTLPGSDLKFRMNEFGIMEMVDDDVACVKVESTEEATQTKLDVFERNGVGSPVNLKEQTEDCRKSGEEEALEGGELTSAVRHPKGSHAKGSPSGGSPALGRPAGDEIHCCDGCGCYGLASEFLSGRFCGKGCADQVAAMALAARRVREARLRQKKRRQRRREILRAAAIAIGPASQSEAVQSAGSNDSGGETPSSVMGSAQENSIKPSQLPSSLKATPVNSEEDNTSNDALPPDHKMKSEIGSSSSLVCRVPWKVGKNGFSWTKYLDHCKAKAAPQYLFRDIYPCAKNSFKAGMRLEGIDPEHPSLFCVLTVAQVRGYRMRLHFDGYPDIHDFWTNSDSPDLFPAGWCEKNGHRLQPPKGYAMGMVGSDGGADGPCFNWAAYLKQCRAQAAPRHLFAKKAYSICPTGFRTGMKLEAVDRKNQSLVCVATVADLLDSRILVHFDGWADVYDYWADPSSPYIHPVGWCKENGHPLTPPNGYSSPGPFSWETYLAETGSVAAPARAFKQRPPSGFRSGMRLEAVDPRVPSLVRVATVDEVRGHRLRLRFDGWSWNQDYAFWIDDDSPDIHPVGWCMHTGHPLEPPLTAEEASMWPRMPDSCPTPGCRGLGNSRGAPYCGHVSPSECPLTSKVLPPLPDRLDPSVLRIRHSGEEEEEGLLGDDDDVAMRGEEGESDEDDDDNDDEDEDDESKPPPPKMRRGVSPTSSGDWDRVSDGRPRKGMASHGQQQQQAMRNHSSSLPPPPPLRLGPAHLPGFGRGMGRGSGSRGLNRHETSAVPEARDVRRDVHRSVFSPGYLPNPDRLTPLCWDRHSRLLHPFVNGEVLPGREASRWTWDEVVKFVENIPGCKERAKVFRDEQIDGEAFLLLNQNDIVTLLGFKLGPAIKVYNSIVLLRQRLTM
ncbi:lethal(3)malignant brain tumor-like protein 3 isoform X2 [Ischnura elegans]|uniref:lethal(3)malignant brain tumor-like protein 3 isoform X2 n=1 Tax=Ischnura elegans TaxID=197161 RepID=UPI001ED8AED1|nr:lethal(3)malignant brain tumor-like protein 3 isoform X2 [Ischnura elegans]